MNAIDKARNLTTQLTDEALSAALVAVEQAAPTPVKSLVHDWLNEELLRRLGEDAYDAYLFDYDEDGNPASPLKYLRPEADAVADAATTDIVVQQFRRLIAA